MDSFDYPISQGWQKYNEANVYSSGRLHHGIDWACPEGTVVPFPYKQAGVVIVSQYDSSAGNMIHVEFSCDGHYYIWRALHLSERWLNVGDTVQANGAVGLSGSTGYAFGPHLHEDLSQGWFRNFVNPRTPSTRGFLTNVVVNNEEDGGVMTDEREKELYREYLGREREGAHSGRTELAFFRDALAEIRDTREGLKGSIANLQAALATEQQKPPKETIKEVIKIVDNVTKEYVDRPVEVVREVEKPFTDQDGLNWLKKKINQLFGKAIFK